MTSTETIAGVARQHLFTIYPGTIDCDCGVFFSPVDPSTSMRTSGWMLSAPRSTEPPRDRLAALGLPGHRPVAGGGRAGGPRGAAVGGWVVSAAERVYVAGPMSGYPGFNYPAFFAAADRLRKVGIEPINPARIDGREDCKEWLDFMRASLIDIAACDGIATLPGWQDSRGAALEVHIARSLDLPVAPVETWLNGLNRPPP